MRVSVRASVCVCVCVLGLLQYVCVCVCVRFVTVCVSVLQCVSVLGGGFSNVVLHWKLDLPLKYWAAGLAQSDCGLVTRLPHDGGGARRCAVRSLPAKSILHDKYFMSGGGGILSLSLSPKKKPLTRCEVRIDERGRVRLKFGRFSE